MRIAIDARALSWEGIGRYTCNLLINLGGLSDEHRYTALISKNDVKRFDEIRSRVPEGKIRAHVVDGAYYSWREQVLLPWQLYRVRADLFHFTHFNVPLFFNRPYVVTIHDCTRFNFPGQQRQGLFQQAAYEAVFASAVRRARGIITVSESTRGELARLPVKTNAEITVVYEGVEEVFVKEADATAAEKLSMLLGISGPYILYVGVWMSHKNIDRLIKAFALVQKLQPELRLVITGKPKKGYAPVSRAVHDCGLRDMVIFPGFVPDYLMPALYQQAVCLAFPSLYEGFGLPGLEACRAGTSVVASNVTSMPEILGAAAVYVNPESVESIAEGLKKVLSNPELREELGRRGKEQAEKFSWERCAEEHVEAYEKVKINRKK